MRVVVAEDGALFRDGLVLLLQASGHEVLAAVSSGSELLHVPALADADVAILDIMMEPEPLGGLQTAKKLREQRPGLGLLLLSHYAEATFLDQMLAIGTSAIGYRLKDRFVSVQALSDTLSRIADGELVIEPALANSLVDRSLGGSAGTLDCLTERELEVLRLMAEGRSNIGVASELFLSVKAVEKHIASLFSKLTLPSDQGSQNRRVLAVLAYLRAQPPWLQS